MPLDGHVVLRRSSYKEEGSETGALWASNGMTVGPLPVKPRRIDVCSCVPVEGLEFRGGSKGWGLWNIKTHPIVWNCNCLPRFYLYLGPKMDLLAILTVK